MNWSSFVPDLIVGLVGAASTGGIAVGTYFLQLRRRNQQLIRNLADDLAARRAFELIVPSVGGGASDEADRCFRSVHSAQQRISVIRDEISPNDRLRMKLQAMVFWCVDYKEFVEKEPEQWRFGLMNLRRELLACLREVERVAGLSNGSLPEPGSLRVSHVPS